MKLHDLHHVLTGYAADWTGEAEIGAWELGAGCGAHYAAWILNVAALQYGFFIAPRRVLAAMARGRRSKSLYSAAELDDSALDESVGSARTRLGIPGEVAPGPMDALALAGWLGAGLALWATPLAMLATVIAALV